MARLADKSSKGVTSQYGLLQLIQQHKAMFLDFVGAFVLDFLPSFQQLGLHTGLKMS